MRAIAVSVFALILAATAGAQTLPTLGGGLGAYAAPPSPQYMTTQTTASHSSVRPGQTMYVAMDVTVGPGYAWYSPNAGTSGDFTPLPASLAVKVQPEQAKGQVRVEQVLWPADKPHTYQAGKESFTNNAYEGRVVVYARLSIDAAARPGRYTVTLQPRGQVCGHDACIPLRNVESSATFEVASTELANPLWAQVSAGLDSARPAEALASTSGGAGEGAGQAAAAAVGYGLLGGFGLALVAGLILNIMPCVLPVIPLKVLGLVQQAGQSRRRFVTLGLAFSAGVVAFFAAIAVFNVVLRLALESTFQWGWHFQSTAFRLGMAALLTVLAANLFGLFNVLAPKRAGAAEAALSQRRGHLKAVGMGLLTGVLATPCSFAILTAALAFAQSLPLVTGSLAIVTIGVGMALPYAILTAFPGLVDRLPRPGRWMELFKQSMGFVLVLVAIWLLSTAAENTYPYRLAAMAVVLGMCVWMALKWVGQKGRSRLAVRVAAAMLAVGAASLLLPPDRPLAVAFTPFDQARIDQASRSGRTVLVDFTASWCLTCKQVESSVYDSPDVAAMLHRMNVLAVRGDITTSDLPANKLKEQLGEAVPVTAIYPPGQSKPILLRGLFSREDLIQALQKAQAVTQPAK